MLLALCHHCWAWMEPKHERCGECGGAVDLNEPDPAAGELRVLFGESLGVVGEASLKRPKLPSGGVLSAMEHGLLFLPDLRQLSTGGLVAVDQPARSLLGRSTSSFWSLFSRRSNASPPGVIPVVRPRLSAEAAVNRFLECPGAVFLRRDSIVRVLQRGTMLRVERKPGRTVAWRLETPLSAVQEQLRRLKNHAAWSQTPVLLNG